MLRKVRPLARNLVGRILRSAFALFPVRKNKILFYVHEKRGLCGNAKYIIRTLAKGKNLRTCRLRILYATRFPETVDAGLKKELGITVIKYPGIRYMHALATCGLLVTDDGVSELYRKRRKQLFISSWHGGGVFKEVGLGTARNADASEYLHSLYDSLDYMLVSCRQNVDDYSRAFNLDKERIKLLGMPRTDILFAPASTKDAERRVRDFYSIPADKKIVLAAPTFRNDNVVFLESKEIETILISLSELLGSRAVCLYRSHYLDSMAQSVPEGADIINASDYPDAQELVCAAAVLVSDYSSIMYDFALMKKPVFLLQRNAEEYVANNRSFFVAPAQWPFVISGGISELCDSIRRFNRNLYEEKITGFMQEIGAADDGKSSERSAAFIEELTLKNKEK